MPNDPITASLRGEGFNFAAMQTGGQAADLTARAERLITDQAVTSAAATPAPAP